MTVIELPDNQAAALRAKAAAQGLSLEDWLKQLATEATPLTTLSREEAVALIRGIQSREQA